MQQPARVDMEADRYVAFTTTITIVEEAFESESVFKMEVRDRKDGGALRVSLEMAATEEDEGLRLIYGGNDTVANHVAAGRLEQEDADSLGLDSGATVALSLIGVRIDETTMETMPFAVEIGEDVDLYYDMHITPVRDIGGVETIYLKDVWIAGRFKVRAGVTI